MRRLARREARVHATVTGRHPNIVRLYDAYQSASGRLTLVSPLVAVTCYRCAGNCRAVALPVLLTTFEHTRAGALALPWFLQVMEYCQRCLHTELRRHPGGMPGPLVKVLAWQLVHGLAFLHSNNVGTGHVRTAGCGTAVK